MGVGVVPEVNRKKVEGTRKSASRKGVVYRVARHSTLVPLNYR